MVNTWLFDVDGTLTPSRSVMSDEFRRWFLNFARHNTVSIVSGSDNPKTLEQLGAEVVGALHTRFNCLGNSVWRQDAQVHTSAFELTCEERAFLLKTLDNSAYPVRTGIHIEQRPGIVNFSIVGRGANLAQRRDYFEWDNRHREREAIAREVVQRFARIGCQIAGETGVDIFPAGADKRQVLSQVAGPVYFFGDQTAPGGNDYPLVEAIAQRSDGSRAHSVNNWEDTWQQLQAYHRQGLLRLA